MKTRIGLVVTLAMAFMLPVTLLMTAEQARAAQNVPPSRPEGPCDIYAAEGCPCVAAHSTTRALYASYNGPLYQIMRQSDGKTLDIGVVQPSAGDAGQAADALKDKGAARVVAYCTHAVLSGKLPGDMPDIRVQLD